MSRYDDVDKVWDDRTFKAYASVTDRPVKWLIGGLLGFSVLVVIIALVGWQANWWFTVQNAKRHGQIMNIENQNIQKGYANQTTLREQITANMQTVVNETGELPFVSSDQKPAIEVQRKYAVNLICSNAAQISGVPLNGLQASFVNKNCSAGSITTTSQYWVP